MTVTNNRKVAREIKMCSAFYVSLNIDSANIKITTRRLLSVSIVPCYKKKLSWLPSGNKGTDMFGDKIQHDCISTSFLQICRCKSYKLFLGSFLSKLYSHLIKLLRPIERLPVLLEASNSLLLVIHGLMPSATMHVLLW